MPIIVFLLLVAFVQQFLISFNIRNISNARAKKAAATSFLIAINHGVAVMIIASRLDNWLNLFFYGLGAALGVVASIKFDMYVHRKRKRRGKNVKTRN